MSIQRAGGRSELEPVERPAGRRAVAGENAAEEGGWAVTLVNLSAPPRAHTIEGAREPSASCAESLAGFVFRPTGWSGQSPFGATLKYNSAPQPSHVSIRLPLAIDGRRCMGMDVSQ